MEFTFKMTQVGGAVVGREVASVVDGDEVSGHDERDEDGDEDAGVLDRAHHLPPEGLDLGDADVVLRSREDLGSKTLSH